MKLNAFEGKRKVGKIFFTADEHYWHSNMIAYASRPFNHYTHMNDTMISKNNEVVSNGDLVVHVGDFTMSGFDDAVKIARQLRGNHIFLRGNHDKWMEDPRAKSQTSPLTVAKREIWEKRVDHQWIVACHYAMRTWPRSHHGSWQVYGHSHATLPPGENQVDVGVDNWDFYPVSFEQVKEYMGRPKGWFRRGTGPT